MKKIILILITVLTVFHTFSQNKTTTQQKLEVYYFHSTNRCATCRSIETNTKKVLDTFFKKEVAAGTIKMYVLDCEDVKNKALADKFEAFSSTLVLLKKSGTKETKEDVTNFAFSYSKNNPDKFNSGLKEKIEKLLK